MHTFNENAQLLNLPQVNLVILLNYVKNVEYSIENVTIDDIIPFLNFCESSTFKHWLLTLTIWPPKFQSEMRETYPPQI